MSKNDWQTPPELFNKLNKVFNFNLDVCASDENALCENYFTEEDSALPSFWNNRYLGSIRAFMNPPYSPSALQSKFLINAMIEEAGRKAETVCIVPVSTGSKWWVDTIWRSGAKVIFLAGGRVPFINPETGKPAKGNRQDSCLVIFGDEFRKLADEMTGGKQYWEWRE